MRRALPAAVALATATTAFLYPVLPSSAAPAAPSQSVAFNAPVSKPANRKVEVKTPFVFGASGFGTLVKGATIPAGSSQTGYIVMGCNRIAGKDRNNFVASVDLPGLGTINGVTTRVFSKKEGRTFSAVSVHKIAGISLLDTPLGSLEIGAIETRSESFNKNGKYGSKVSVDIAKLTFTPPGGSPTTLALPLPGAPIVIPGLVKISLGTTRTEKGADFAKSSARGVKITLFPTNTTVTVGKTKSSIELNKTRGIFNGYGVGVEAQVLDGVANVGRTAFQPLPCVGTDGDDATKRLASADLSPLATTGGLVGGVNGRWTSNGPVANTAGVAADVSLLDDALQVKLAVGVANVRRNKDGKLFRSTKGSTIGAITANGQSYSLDPLEALNIPGVAKLERGVVENLPNGVKVIGLRITALDGTLAVIDLGVAKATIRPTKKS